ncbi:MAG: hypothetical protein ABJ251_03490 [Paracoccaceae bacterium]
MKLDLADALWDRLYGPYGNRSVNEMLETLAEQWDDAVAEELYWEELHHQDDIFPATFAALPWLVELSPSSGKEAEKTALFMSHVIHCAFMEGGNGWPRGKYKGLSTNISDHQLSWLSESEWLKADDLATLLKLEKWFTDNCQTIAERCLNFISADIVTSAYALKGFATANDSVRVAWSTHMFANGESVDLIQEDLGDYNQRDTLVVQRLYPHIHQKNPELAAFLLDYPGCTFVPDDPRQTSFLTD